MLTKNEIKEFVSLKQKKYRIRSGKFIAEGIKVIEMALFSRVKPEVVVVSSTFANSNPVVIKEYKNQKLRVEEVPVKTFVQISDTETPQGVLAVFSFLPKNSLDSLLMENYKKSETVVCLEDISDPGNLGAILRTCDWFGFTNVLLTAGCADIYNSKVVRSSMGSIFNLKIFYDLEIKEVYSSFSSNEYQISVADISGENIYSRDFQDKSVVIFCNEGSGPSKELKKYHPKLITIPGLGNAESLNVSAAAAVVLSEIQKGKLLNL